MSKAIRKTDRAAIVANLAALVAAKVLNPANVKGDAFTFWAGAGARGWAKLDGADLYKVPFTVAAEPDADGRPVVSFAGYRVGSSASVAARAVAFRDALAVHLLIGGPVKVPEPPNAKTDWDRLLDMAGAEAPAPKRAQARPRKTV